MGKAPSRRKQGKGGRTGKTVRVLIADDRPQSRKGLQALLTTCPEVEVVGNAADGREAVELAEERRPDVVVIDARMPVMDGLEAARLIKDQYPETRVVMLTMYSSCKAQAAAAGADAFLVKGCPIEKLLKAVLEG